MADLAGRAKHLYHAQCRADAPTFEITTTASTSQLRAFKLIQGIQP